MSFVNFEVWFGRVSFANVLPNPLDSQAGFLEELRLDALFESPLSQVTEDRFFVKPFVHEELLTQVCGCVEINPVWKKRDVVVMPLGLILKILAKVVDQFKAVQFFYEVF